MLALWYLKVRQSEPVESKYFKVQRPSLVDSGNLAWMVIKGKGLLPERVELRSVYKLKFYH
jgi:hypothetical protein